MKTFEVTVRHDSGQIKMTTDAFTAGLAIQSVMNFENCPLSAIISVEEKGREVSVVETKKGGQNLVQT